MTSIGIAHHVLDHQLIDSRGERCGKVDDVALEQDGDERLLVSGVLAGPGALHGRMRRPSTRWLFALAGLREVAVGWRDVADIVDHVTLARPAPELGLSRGEQHAAEVVARVFGPDAHAVKLGPDSVADVEPPGDDVLRLSHLLGVPVVGPDGTALGRLRELHAAKDGPILSEAAGNAWRVTDIQVGWRGVLDRLGLPGRERGRNAIDASRVVDWRAVPIQLR